MDIPVWKMLCGGALLASLLLGSIAEPALAKSRSRRKAEAAAAQEQQQQEAQAPQQQAPAAAPEAQPAQQAQPNGVVPAAAASQPGVPQQYAQTSGSYPAAQAYTTTQSYPQGYVQDGGEYYCDECQQRMGLCDRLRNCDAQFKCWKMNHCPCLCCGCGCCLFGGNGAKNLRNTWMYTHKGMYPADPNYFDTRDLQVHSAQWTGVPTSVPLAPVVRYAYNDGWGVPASRITTVGSTYNRWYPREWYGFEQSRRPAPVGADGKPLASRSPAPIYWPTDTTQHGEYYKHVPQWQPAQRTRWSNVPGVLGVPAPTNPTVNLTPYTPVMHGAPPSQMAPATPISPPGT